MVGANYTNFTSNVIAKGYAERVPAGHLDRCDGRVGIYLAMGCITRRRER